MEIIKDTAIFKSDLDNFQAEQTNKRNTERLLTREETVEVEEWLRKGILQPHKIKITCIDKTYKVNESFIRTLTDVRKIGEICGYNQYVFSW